MRIGGNEIISQTIKIYKIAEKYQRSLRRKEELIGACTNAHVSAARAMVITSLINAAVQYEH